MELKSLTQQSECAGIESGCLRILSECLGCLLHTPRGPFYSPKAARAIGCQLGRPNLPSVRWCTEQSDAPPDSHCCLSGGQFPSKSGTVDRCSSEPVGAPDTIRCTPNSPVHPADRWSSHESRVDHADDRWHGRRWLTGQSGAPPDSPMNYSHVALFLFPRATSLPRMTHRTVRCTTGRSGEL